jgi:hypothetical protein
VEINYIHHDRQCTHEHNTAARLHNNYCRGKTRSIKYSECVCVASGVEHTMRMRHTVICGDVQLYHIFLHFIINGTICG